MVRGDNRESSLLWSAVELFNNFCFFGSYRSSLCLIWPPLILIHLSLSVDSDRRRIESAAAATITTAAVTATDGHIHGPISNSCVIAAVSRESVPYGSRDHGIARRYRPVATTDDGSVAIDWL